MEVQITIYDENCEYIYFYFYVGHEKAWIRIRINFLG